MTDLNANQNAVTRYENPTPVQAVADIVELRKSLAAVLANPETTPEEAKVVRAAILRQIAHLGSAADFEATHSLRSWGGQPSRTAAQLAEYDWDHDTRRQESGHCQ